MKQLLKLVAICGLGAAFLSGAFAAQHHHPAHHTAPKCPACHMTLSTHWTKATPIAVRVKKGGKTFYCCSTCVKKMPKWMIVHKHVRKHH